MRHKDRSGGTSAFTPARIAVTALAILSIVFICVNTQEVTIRVIIPKVTMPLWAALLGVFLAGVLCGAGFLLFRRRKAR
ncbi:lipopolysaccharide assembly protein LapA domain-containing protein [Streptomyces argenteolus]|uniref:Lipopolysaccharide assembly protein LapA domain-containing protein n=1 Tax=Streptomyces argenteolus TaxID=67274 RepID=A0ABW6XBD1_9ACTN